jgi:hypothetical protein
MNMPHMFYTSFNIVYRKLDEEQLGGTDRLYVTANSETVIPGCAKKFGSTVTPIITGDE